MALNPYTNQTFLSFFKVFVSRFFGFVKGEFSFGQLVSDEIQVIVLAGVAVSCALVGTFLVLRRMTMLANSLSHTLLVGIALTFFLLHRGFNAMEGFSTQIAIGIMLLASLSTGLLTAVFTQFLTNVIRLQEDASIGIVFTTFFAIGVILMTVLMRNAHFGTEVVMGNVDALHVDDVKLVYLILSINILGLVLFFKEYKVTTFDPGFSLAVGIPPLFFSYLLMIQSSATIVGAFRAVGILMVLALMTGPVITARLITYKLERVLVLASLIGIIASFMGVALSRHLLTVYDLSFSTAGIVVCVIVVGFIAVVMFTHGSNLGKWSKEGSYPRSS